MKRRELIKGAAAGAVLLAGGRDVWAQAAAGRDYIAITPPQPADASKIEVMEFFSYMCPHCHEFEPILSRWAKAQGADIVFRRVPVIFRESWEAGARMYYTLAALGENARLDAQVFEAVQKGRVDLSNEKQRNDWVSSQSVDLRRFADTWKSFGVDSQVKRGAQAVSAYKVTGVPSIAIDGRFLALTAGGFEAMLRTVDQLIARVRSERRGK